MGGRREVDGDYVRVLAREKKDKRRIISKEREGTKSCGVNCYGVN